MKQFLAISILFLSMLMQASAADFNSANEAYKQGNYAEAAREYEQIIKEEGAQGNVLFNLGNAYYKLGEFPKAILYYEKALKLAPNDDDIRHNLDIANLKVIDKIEATPEFFLLTWWKQLAAKARSNTWAIAFIVLFWLGVISLITLSFVRIRRAGLLSAAGISLVALSIIFLLLSVTQNTFETSGNHGIIQAASVSVKSAPAASGTDLFIIHEGLKVGILQSEGSWLRIKLADGKEGWVQGDNLEVI